MGDLISVVVPIYNVEEYIINCINSIVRQTYRNLEIILVDDGSKDNSGHIADELAESDARIKVIHKLNGGLSDARNAAIDIVTGQYITFVDGDDYLPEDAISVMYKLLKKSNAQIAIGSMASTSILNETNKTNNNSELLLSIDEALLEMLYGRKFSTSAPGKLYKTSLFENIRYPYGKFSEDLFTTYKLILKANNIVYCDRTVYYYYRRTGSITRTKFSEKQLHVVEALEQIKKEVPKEKMKYVEKAYASQVIDGIMLMLERDPNPDEIFRLGLWDKVKEYRHIVVSDKNATNRVRIYALISYFGIRPSIFFMKAISKKSI